MAYQTMHRVTKTSPESYLTEMISATATEMTIASIAGLADSMPTLLTVGTDEEVEVIRCTSRVGARFTAITRGMAGTTPRIWPAGTPVTRTYTVEDHNLFIDNITDNYVNKLDKAGNGAKVTVKFTEAAELANLATGETLAVLFGKLMHWYARLGQAAWMGTGQGADSVAAGNHLHDGRYVRLDGDGMAEAARIMTRSVKQGNSRALALADAGRCLDVTASTAVILTIQTDAYVNFPVDTEIEVAQEGVGKVTIQAQSGVTLRSVKGSKASFEIGNQYGMAVLKKKGANDWRVMGDIV